ncbi:MAG TPA: hypothetical protein PLV92_09930, partial [Pirellulaceae bacterium]|nr:hypothetical protein [Pirellulaceae bacterium]
LASTIVGSIPNEYAMAAGKTANLVATVTQQGVRVANEIYNEAKLWQAWKVTRAALDAPANRELGLEALKLNPTLGVHALAWAGFEKQPVDPIARAMLKQLGLTEQSLAASGTEAKVRKYLETVLYEDRKLVDSSKIVTDWAPKSVTLSTRDWFLTTSRAAQVATPKLRAGDDKAVLAALKVVDQQNVVKLQEEIDAVVALVAELEQLMQTQSESGIEDDQVEAKRSEAEERASSVQKQLDKFLSEAQAAVAAIGAYDPRTTDGQPHSEMANLVATFQKLAAERRELLRKLETILAEVG